MFPHDPKRSSVFDDGAHEIGCHFSHDLHGPPMPAEAGIQGPDPPLVLAVYIGL